MMHSLNLIKHRTSGDVYVADVDDDTGLIHARTLPLASSEWSDGEGNVRADLDLTAFAVDWPEEEPLPDADYRYLATQAAGQLTIYA